MVQETQELLMKTFKQHLEENRLATLAATAGMIAGSAMAAPPKPEAMNRMVEFIKQKEGFRPVAELDKDATGNPPVVGYGTTHTYPDTGNRIQVGEKITKEKAEEHIRTYLNKMTPRLEKIPGWDDMDAGKQAALMSFGHNFGSGFYGHKNFKSLTADLKNKNWDNVPETLQLYNKSGGKVLGGLVKRRAEEGQWWKGDNSSTPKTPTITPNDIHNVAKGDTLGAIAKKYGTSVENIQKLNPEITDPNKIGVGQKIKTK